MKAPKVAYIIAAEYGVPRRVVDCLWDGRPDRVNRVNFSPRAWRLAVEDSLHELRELQELVDLLADLDEADK